MWIVIPRRAVPDAPYWPGRRWLAVVDALAWPVAWVTALSHVAAGRGGVFLATMDAVLFVWAANRLHRSLAENARYRFTTWRLAKVVAFGLLLSVFLKVLV